VVVFASGCTQQNNNTTVQNNTTQPQNTTNITKAIDVVAVQKGPDTAKKGMNVTVQYEVTNKGNETIYNAQIISQGYSQLVGTLKPGEARTYTNSKVYIPTDAEVQRDFGANSTVSNPFVVGGFSVTFNDAKGAIYSVLSNSIEIKLA
jgi:hypothetical protein